MAVGVGGRWEWPLLAVSSGDGILERHGQGVRLLPACLVDLSVASTSCPEALLLSGETFIAIGSGTFAHHHLVCMHSTQA